MESLRKVRSFMPVTVKCYGRRCMPGSMLSVMSTHAFLGIDSEQEHCKTRVFVLTRRTRESPSDLFFLSSKAQPLAPTRSLLSLISFFESFHCANHRSQTFSFLTFSSPTLSLSLSLLSILYRLFLFVVSIYANSSTAIEKRAFLI